MAKIKSAEVLSLKTSDQRKVSKQTKKLKKKIKSEKALKRFKRQAKTGVEKNRGLIYIGHLPHGFFEDEMRKYFKQFGPVTNVKVCRSNKSGRSKGFGYVEFAHPDVAKIAAETMNNYLMFKKRVVAEFVSSEKRPKGLFKGRSSTIKRYSSKVRAEKQRLATIKMDEATHLKRSSARLSRLNKKLQKLKNVGVELDFKPINVPDGITKEIPVEDVSHTFEQDPFDSDIEVKVPVTRGKSTTRVSLSDSDTKVKSSKKEVLKTTKKVVSKVRLNAKSTKSEAKSPKKTPKRTAVTQSPKRTPVQATKKSPKQKSIRKKVVQK